MKWNWGSKQASSSSLAAARNRRNRFLMLCPALLVVGVAASSTGKYGEYTPLQASKAQNDRLLAYVGVVRDADGLNRGSAAASDADQARKVAQRWMNEFEEGKLQPLRPANYEDGFLDGPKAEIMQASDRITGILTAYADKQAQDGHYRDAAKDVLLAYKVQDTLRYSDLSSISLMALRERKLLDMLNQYAPKLDEETRNEIQETLKASQEGWPMDKIAAVARTQYAEMMARDGGEPVSAKESQLLRNLTEEKLVEKDYEEAATKMRREAREALGSKSQLVSDVLLTYASDLSQRMAIQEAIEQAKSPKPIKKPTPPPAMPAAYMGQPGSSPMSYYHWRSGPGFESRMPMRGQWSHGAPPPGGWAGPRGFIPQPGERGRMDRELKEGEERSPEDRARFHDMSWK